MDIKSEIAAYNVSRETFLKLEEFVAILKEWNEKMNLVSKSSLQNVWERHVLDTLQLVQYIPQSTQNLVDIGSGSGFPGVVLAVVLQSINPTTKIYLVESIHKKTMYLNDVCARLKLDNVTVINSRIEDSGLSKADVVTARAVAALDTLCEYQYKIQNKNAFGLYLKGKTYQQELFACQNKWQFDLNITQNHYNSEGVVIQLSNLRKKRK